VTGLGSASFISSLQLSLNITSTTQGLGSVGYVSTTQLASTVRGLGSSGYVSSLIFVTLVSSQQIFASTLAAGNVLAAYMSTPQIITSSFYGNLADAFTVIVYDM
jgi:hypothetical protein